MRMLWKALIAVVVLLALVAGGGYLYLRRSLPQLEGTIVVAGLSAPIDVVRDADAIPHVFATNKQDALFGLGYVHAQDRLWQMELQRRIAFGRLSAVLGPAAVPQDRFLRTVGFGRAAKSAWETTPDWARQQINAYLAGVNAFIAGHHGAGLPPEFTLLRFEPEPFTGPDVLAWVKMMAWDLSANYAFELLRHDLANAVGAERMAQLMPPYAVRGLSITEGPGWPGGPGEAGGSGASGGPGGSGGSGGPGGSDATHQTSLNKPSSPTCPTCQTCPACQTHPTYPALPAFMRALASDNRALTEALLGGAGAEAIGSNNWVVDGTLTATGKPMLANDPHLGARLPSTWYLAHVTGGDFEIIGATLPGAPAVALGRNRYIAWGATNVAADVEDLYREHIDPTGKLVEFRGAQEPIAIIPETIHVKGAADVLLNVRITRHGPIVSDAINANNAESRDPGPRPPALEPLAFRWTALDRSDSTVSSFLRLNEARNWSEFTDALRDFVAPAQNFVYADVDGHIGYYAPGRIPVRASGDGSAPADGWTGTAEWTGWIPFDDLPHLYDPPTHVIVTANHRPAPASYGYHLGLEWPEPYRAQRILDLLGSIHLQNHRFTVDDFARIQADTVSLHAKTMVPLLLAHAQPTTAADRQALDLLRRWDFDARGDSAAEAIFAAWFQHLAPAIVEDDLGQLLGDRYKDRYSYVTRFVIHTLTTNDAGWCDDVRTPQHETCDAAVSLALRQGVADLEQRLGSDMARWRWDAVHHAVFPHQGLDAVAALRPILSRSVPNGGDWSTVDVGPVATDHPYEQHNVPGYREIIDLSPVNDSRFIDAVGESGHFLSRHYDDFQRDWHDVRHRRMRMSRADVDSGALGHLRLTP
ncbi:MAG TPA: penicillin acylase family protein [Vicinamibacterales bacterium]|nr:penicillin acylase family protein [Vicinamibacterales bacterium]